jgi:N-acetyl sugar amidotransferase
MTTELAERPVATGEVRPRYRICTRCVMDTSDPEIRFSADGVCNHCEYYAAVHQTHIGPVEARAARLDALVERIKRDGRGRDYDCVIGVSGGVDSTYVALLVAKLGLRPIAVHLDNGWDAELAVKNVENIVTRLRIDLFTHVLDWPQFRDLQVAFLRASVPDAEIPTDHAIGAVLYQTATRHGIRHIVSGTNVVSEAIMPVRWTYGVGDWRYIASVHRRFGSRSLKGFPHYSLADQLAYQTVRRIRLHSLLDYVEYDKVRAMQEITSELGWRDYGGKHYESLYTKFFQGSILPRKFGIDKRRAHQSTLINSGQTTREAALEVLRTPPLPPEEEATEREYVIKKLGLSAEAFDEIMRAPVRSYLDYPNSIVTRRRVSRLVRLGRRLRLIPGLRPA